MQKLEIVCQFLKWNWDTQNMTRQSMMNWISNDFDKTDNSALPLATCSINVSINCSYWTSNARNFQKCWMSSKLKAIMM